MLAFPSEALVRFRIVVPDSRGSHSRNDHFGIADITPGMHVEFRALFPEFDVHCMTGLDTGHFWCLVVGHCKHLLECKVFNHQLSAYMCVAS